MILFIVGCEAPTVGYNTYEWVKITNIPWALRSIEIAMTQPKHGMIVILKK